MRVNSISYFSKAARAVTSVGVLLGLAATSQATVQVRFERNVDGQATPAFSFKGIPSPASADAGTRARFTILDGEADENGAGLDVLHDGKLPSGEDQPDGNFFFGAGTKGGLVRVDLGRPIAVQQVNSYSWHPGSRGPQVYRLFASDGKAEGFNARPKKGADLEKCGWKMVARVDTRPAEGRSGGQYGVSVSDSEGTLGTFRYLLFELAPTDERDTFGNTFYSEIDVVSRETVESVAGDDDGGAGGPPFSIMSKDGYCKIQIDTAGAPDLKEWAEQKLGPVLAEWYPKLTTMLASEGFAPTTNFRVTIKPGRGVAATGGTRISANSSWLKNAQGEMNVEAVGALVHEEVHVVQAYGGGRRNNPNATRSPGWLVEAVADYVRWFKYEPESHGADVQWMRARRNLTLKYDAGYRISANFVDWVSRKYDADLVKKLNAAMRESRYKDELWKEYTGRTVEELGEEWKKDIEAQLAKSV